MSLKSEAIHPLPKAGILDISPYVPGKAQRRKKNLQTVINESPTVLQQRLLPPMHKGISLEFYPDGSATGTLLRPRPLRIECGFHCLVPVQMVLQLLAHAYRPRR
jgi:hypothetical protein